MWTTLASLPRVHSDIRYDEHSLSKLEPSGTNTFLTLDQLGQLWEYNIDLNHFTTIASLKSPSHNLVEFICSYTYNRSQHKLYIYISGCRESHPDFENWYESKMLIYDRKNGTNGTLRLINYIPDADDIGLYATCLIINDSLHLIGCDHHHSNKHLKWDDEHQQFLEIQECADFDRAKITQDTICVQLKKMLLLFEPKWDRLHTYDIVKHKWNMLPSISARLPEYRFVNYESGITTVLNDQYVLLFGGREGTLFGGITTVFSDTIWIFDVSTQTFRKSKVVCPIKASFKACTVTDNRRNELVVFGFVRDLIPNQFPPIYLMKLVQSWYWVGTTFLMDSHCAQHWKINTLDLF
eukprot:559434_1